MAILDVNISFYFTRTDELFDYSIKRFDYSIKTFQIDAHFLLYLKRIGWQSSPELATHYILD